MTTRKASAVRSTARVKSAPTEAVQEEAVNEIAAKAVDAETTQTPNLEANSDTFANLGLHADILKVLKKMGLTQPTPIQRDAIPVVMKNQDIIGIAQTGTGKTFAFGLPILDRFVRNGNRSRGRALIVLPTRELAIQVEENMSKIGAGFKLRTAILIGGAPMKPQLSQLRANPDVIIATPGRLIDHMQSRMLDLRTVDTLVLDEADRMLDMGFAPQIKQILDGLSSERQTMLFSATMPDQIVKLASKYMHQPVRIEIARAGSTADDITQELFIVPQDGKNELLADVLYEYPGTVLVFTRTRSRAARVSRQLKKWDHTAAEIHSDRTLSQRRAALDGFKAGKYRILVATDIAARGIDVKDISLVVNYDLPDCADDYVHRIGRTGRAGKSGHALSFAAPDQADMMRDIEKVIESTVPVSEHSEFEFERISSSSRGGSRRGSGGSKRPAGQSSQRSSSQSSSRSSSGSSNRSSSGSTNRSSNGASSRPAQSTQSRPPRSGNGHPGGSSSPGKRSQPTRSLSKGRSFSAARNSFKRDASPSSSA